MKTNYFMLMLFAALFSVNSQAQTIAIPDTAFEQFLIDEGIDSDGELNGQILTADALSVTNLFITGGGIGESISDLTGLEYFTNIEELFVDFVPFTVSLSGMISLKKLELYYCDLTSLNLEQNVLLEELYVANLWDGPEQYENQLALIDLSNNPKVRTVDAFLNPYLQIIRLNNGNNVNIPDMNIMFSAYDVCVQVDDAEAANQGSGVYQSWQIDSGSYQFSDNCTLATPSFDFSELNIYPNPARELVFLDYDYQLYSVDSITIYDMSGQMIKTPEVNNDVIVVSDLSAGVYLLKIHTSKGVAVRRVVKD